MSDIEVTDIERKFLQRSITNSGINIVPYEQKMLKESSMDEDVDTCSITAQCSDMELDIREETTKKL